MAITKIQTGYTLAIEVQKGVDKAGDPTYSKKSFSYVNPKKTPDDVFEVAQAMEKVFSGQCGECFLVDTSKLVNEEA